MLKRRWFSVVIVGIVLTCVALWTKRTITHRTAVLKFQIGMTLDDAIGQMSRPYPVHACPDAHIYPPTPQELVEAEQYQVYIEHEAVLLTFNHYQRLIRIRER